MYTGKGGRSTVVIIAVVVAVTAVFLLFVAVFFVRAKKTRTAHGTEPLAQGKRLLPLGQMIKYSAVFFVLIQMLKLCLQAMMILPLQDHSSLILRRLKQQLISFHLVISLVKVDSAKSTRYTIFKLASSVDIYLQVSIE